MQLGVNHIHLFIMQLNWAAARCIHNEPNAESTPMGRSLGEKLRKAQYVKDFHCIRLH